MYKPKGKHEQSNRVTIMLVPDSAAKIRHISLPKQLIVITGVLLLLPIISISFFLIHASSLENRLDLTAAQLAEAIAENSRLQSISESSAKTPDDYNDYDSAGSGNVQVIPPQQGADVEHKRLDELEQSLAVLLAKNEIVESFKQDVFDIFERLDTLDIPFSFNLDEILQSGGEVAAGGPYPGMPDYVISELDRSITQSIREMPAIKAYSEFLENYFDSRPIGWPIDERLVDSEFGWRTDPITGALGERHDGIDINSPVGTNVYATADGEVIFAGWNDGGYGFLVIVEHAFGYTTYYAHNSALLVSEGNLVTRGQIIALSGNTGRSTGPHLHYEVRINGIPQNPRLYLG